jgi:hypothetical protein
MNRKQFVLVLILVLVVGGLGLMLYQRNTASYGRTSSTIGGKVLGDFPVNDIAQITIKQDTNALNLVKKDDLWRVRERGDYAANFSDISEFLRQAPDLKFVQREQIGPSVLGRLQLVPPGQGTNAGTLVELKDKDGKVVRTLLLGKKHMRKPSGAASSFGGDEGWPDGRYLKVGDNVGVVANAFDKLEPKAESWLNKDFLKIENIRSVAVVTDKETNWWRVVRTNSTADFAFDQPKPGEELDKNKVSGLGSFLSYGSFNDVLPPSTDLKSVALDKPHAVTVETFDDFKYQLKIGRKTNEENCWVQFTISGSFPKERVAGKDEKPEDKEKLDKEFKEKTKKLEEKLATEKGYEKWIYVMSKWSLDSVLKDRQELFVEKKPEEKKSDEKKEGAAEKKPDEKKDAPPEAEKKSQ